MSTLKREFHDIANMFMMLMMEADIILSGDIGDKTEIKEGDIIKIKKRVTNVIETMMQVHNRLDKIKAEVIYVHLDKYMEVEEWKEE